MERDTLFGEYGTEQPTPLGKEQVESETDAAQVVEIDGHQLNFYADTMEFDPPDGFDEMTAEQQQSIQRKSDEYVMTLSKQKKQSMDLNQKERDLAEKERKLLERERQMSATQNPPKSNDNDPYKYWGVETWQEVNDLQVDNPEAYHNGMTAKATEEATKRAALTQQETAIRNKVISEGYDYSLIKQFAETSNIGNMDVAFDYYKYTNPKPKAKFRDKAANTPISAGVNNKSHSRLTDEQKINNFIIKG